MPEAATDAVPFDGTAGVATDRVGDTGRSGLRRAAATQHEGASPEAAGGGKSTEGAWVTDSPDQAESRVRPFDRRFFNRARPARVCMRWRNPCFLLRRRLLGWNVRFTHGLLGPGRRAGHCAPAWGRGCADPAVYGRHAGRGNRGAGTHAESSRCPTSVLSPHKAGDTFRSPRQRTGPDRRSTSPRLCTFGLGEAARAAAGPGEGFLHTCGCCCGQPG
jgi:hypothetical protein